MRFLNRDFRAAALSLLGALLLTLGGANTAKVPTAHGQEKLKSDVHWKPAKVEVSSEGSRLDLEIPDLAPDADWIVGVQTVEANEKQTISVGLLSWEDSDQNSVFAGKPIKLKLPSKITDYPNDQIKTRRGKVRIPRLTSFDNNSGSLIVYLRVLPGTDVRIWRSGKEFSAPSSNTNFAVHNGVLAPGPKGPHSLVGRLIRSKLLARN